MDLAFTPREEASLPENFPDPGPVGVVVKKDYPPTAWLRPMAIDRFGNYFVTLNVKAFP